MDQKLTLELRCGDAVEELRKTPDESVDLIATDPPYNLGKNYGVNNDSLDFDRYLEFSRAWLGEAVRVLKPTGTIYVFMGMRFISYLYNMMEREFHLRFNSWITWRYSQGIGKTRGFSPRHDDILMFTKSDDFTFNLDPVRTPQKTYRSINNMRGSNPGNVWEFSHIHYCNKNRRPHPSQKPEGLFERMIAASSNEGDLVVDPFLGSGTSARVCQRLVRNFIGVDVNPEYIAAARERLAEPFEGFDSIDERMKRVPNDLNDPEYRKQYVNDHIRWFLQNHSSEIEAFLADVDRKYGGRNSTPKKKGAARIISTDKVSDVWAPLFESTSEVPTF